MIRDKPSIKGHVLHKIAPATFQKFTVIGEYPHRFGLLLDTNKFPGEGPDLR